MSLFPEENILTKEIESWKGFASSLEPEDDRKSFLKMLNDCQKYALAINAKETPFPTEPLIMALLLAQHKMISWLARQTKSSQNSDTLAYTNSKEHPLKDYDVD
jgi:hypothetical protein